jgi:hypothetical protein
MICSNSSSGCIINDVFELCQTPGRGRCVCARTDLPAGTVVLNEEPYAHIVCSAYEEVVCMHCCKLCVHDTIFALAADDPVRYVCDVLLFLLASCLCLCRYCSEQCMRADRTLHGFEAKAVSAVAEKQIGGSGSDNMRLILRIAAAKALEQKTHTTTATNIQADASTYTLDVPKIGAANTFGTAYVLEGRSDALDPSSLQDLTAVSSFISNTVNTHMISTGAGSSSAAVSSSSILSAEQVLHLFLAIQGNAHQIVTPTSRRPIGLGLFPMTSMLNHSCYPNCAHNFVFSAATASQSRVPRLVMKTIQPVKAGEELCYSYIPLYASTVVRRQKLFSAYSFMCDCPRCSSMLGSSSDNSSGGENFGTAVEEAQIDAHMHDGDAEASDVYNELLTDIQQLSVAVQAYEDFNGSEYLTTCGRGSAAAAAAATNESPLLVGAANTVYSIVSDLATKWFVRPTNKRKEFLCSHNYSSVLMSLYSNICKAVAISNIHARDTGVTNELLIVGLRCGQLALGFICKFTGNVRMRETGMLEAHIAQLMASTLLGGAASGEHSTRWTFEQFAELLTQSIQQQQDEEFVTPAVFDVSEAAVADIYKRSCTLAFEIYCTAESLGTEEGTKLLLKYFMASAEHTLRLNS